MVQTTIAAWLKRSSAQGNRNDSHQTVLNVKETREVHDAISRPADTSMGSQQPDTSENLDEGNVCQNGQRPLKQGLDSHSLPSNVEISEITAEILPQFRRMVSVLLPVPYSDSYYKETVSDPVIASISLAAIWSDDSKSRVVSGIRCRLLARSPAETLITWSATVLAAQPSDSDPPPCLYISTIGTLAPYRNKGLAAALLRRVTRTAVDDYGIGVVAAHVWEASDEARAWYAKLGFKEVKYEPNYFRRLTPHGAWVIEKAILPSDLLSGDAFSHGAGGNNVST